MKTLLLLLIGIIAFPTLAAPVSPVPILDAEAIDSTVDPCENFYQYACGKWLKEFPLPADKSSYWHQSGALEEQTLSRLNQIFSAYARGDYSVPSRYARKIGDFYASCMDESHLASASRAPFQRFLQRIGSIQNFEDLARVVGEFHLAGVSAFFSLLGAQDYLDSSRVIAHVGQDGFSLPEKDYYFPSDAKSRLVVGQFKRHIERALKLSGSPSQESRRQAEIVFKIEKRLAQHALATADLYDTSKLNHPVKLEELQAWTPLFPWATYLNALPLPLTVALNAESPEFLRGLNSLLRETPLSQLKTYLRWQVVHAYGYSLSLSSEKEKFHFWEQQLDGQETMAPRWKRCVQHVSEALPEAVGEAYIRFIEQAQTIRERADALADSIKSQFAETLLNSDWLDDLTRDAAQKKLRKVTQKIGFPDRWQSYDSLELSRVQLMENGIRQAQFENRRNLDKIGNPVDRSEWSMPVWEANAYYDPSLNEMVFPLGGIIPPIFDLSASDGANYGALGATMGHELIHGFDTNGSQIDGDGNLKDWWTDSTQKEFGTRTQCFAQQADRYEILPKLFVKGQATLTENIADQGGTRIAYAAFKKATAQKPAAPLFQGLNETQQFFLSYAQSWCNKRTPENLRNRVLADEHPPEEFRVNGVLYNMPEFAQAFRCALGAPMAPKERCRAW